MTRPIIIRQLNLHRSHSINQIGGVSPAVFNVRSKILLGSRCSDAGGIDFYGDGTLNQTNAQD